MFGETMDVEKLYDAVNLLLHWQVLHTFLYKRFNLINYDKIKINLQLS